MPLVRLGGILSSTQVLECEVYAGVARTDLEGLLHAIQSLTQHRDLDSLRHHIVEMLPALVPSNGVAWNEVDLESARVEAVMEPDLVSEPLAEIFRAHVGEHPVISHFTATGDGRPYAISDFLSARQFRATAIYQQFYRHLGAEDQISFILPDPRFVVGIALNRCSRGFTEQERQILNALRPHLVQAYRNAEDFSRLQHSIAGMEVLVEQRREGLVVLDRRGFVEHCTPRAQEICARWFSGPISGLPPEVLAWLDSAGWVSGPTVPLLIDRHDRHLMVRRVPVPEGEVLLFSESRDERTISLLQRLGLSRREAEVLLLLADGQTTARTAAVLGISPRTVDKHVQHGYSKLGVENRVSLTNLVRQLERE
jgi:DNA-binding CsgD family transcriptional regulator